MNYQQWRLWLRSIPLSLRWFVYLILLRPAIDNFYYLKEFSIFLSPNYIIGALSPILALVAFLRIHRSQTTKIDRLLKTWSVLICLNICAVLIDELSFYSLELCLKIIVPIYMYFLMRRIITSRTDLQGILQTFLYSLILPFIVFLYELLFDPISITYSRGLQRIQGAYADVSNYGFYINMALAVTAYFFLRSFNGTKAQKGRNLFFMVIVVGGFGLLKISHAASFAVFGTILLMLFFMNLDRKVFGRIILVMSFVILFYSAVRGDLHAQISSLLEKDIAVLEGDLDEGRAFHGRWSRWERHLGIFNDTPLLGQLFGWQVAPEVGTHLPLTAGAHNDYLRILYATGYIGLSVYLLAMLKIVKKSVSLHRDEKFLVISFIAFIFLYSVSTAPTVYVNVMPIATAVFAYVQVAPELRTNLSGRRLTAE